MRTFPIIAVAFAAVLGTAACGSNPPKQSGWDTDGGPSRGNIDGAPSETADDGGAAADTNTPADSPPTMPADASGPDDVTMPVLDAFEDNHDSGPGDAPGGICKDEPTYTGPLLIFAGGPNFGGGGAVGQCGLANDQLPKGRFFGAVDSALYAQAQACGACVRIESLDGKIMADIQVSDRVDPLFRSGGHVVSADAEVHGRFSPGDNPDVRFHFVPCEVDGKIRVQFDATTTMGSSLLVMNYRTQLAGVQVATAGGWKALDRTPFNRWPIPFSINGQKNSVRFIDTSGRMVDATDVPFTADLQQTDAQFPDCKAGPKR